VAPGLKRLPARREVREPAYDLLAVQSRLSEFFGTPVKVTTTDEKGKIEITFFGTEGLNRILDAVGLPETQAYTPPKEKFRV
jgi:hypothetical protein